MKIENEIDSYIVFLAFCQMLCYNDKIEMETFVKFLLKHWDQLDNKTQNNCKWEIMHVLYDIDNLEIRKELKYGKEEEAILRKILDKPYSIKNKKPRKKKITSELVL